MDICPTKASATSGLSCAGLIIMLPASKIGHHKAKDENEDRQAKGVACVKWYRYSEWWQ